MSEDRETKAPQPGDVLAGKYEVERVLGEGGMGIVVSARHRQLDQKVALKFMHEGVAKVAIQRFMKEAKAVAKLRSENVARVMDVGTLENGAPYIVMEYLEGEDLSALSKSGIVPVVEAIDYVLQASVALAEAHAGGIVHRDIKPGNLFLTRRPDGAPLVKVLDFGISKMQSTDAEVDGSTTRTGTVMGSPAYMSPEQVRSSKLADARSDIWSLGVVLFHLITGKMPFDAETVPDMFVAILHEPARTATSANPALPPAMDEIFARCFAKEATGRYQNLAEMAVALEPFAALESRGYVSAIARLVGGTAAPRAPLRSLTVVDGSSNAEEAASNPANPTTQAALSVSQPPNLVRRWPWILAASVVMLGGVGVVTMLVISKQQARIESAPSEPVRANAFEQPTPVVVEEPKPVVSPTSAPPPSASVETEAAKPREIAGKTNTVPVVKKGEPDRTAKPGASQKPTAEKKPAQKPEEGQFETIQ